jgi:hypothetical protein
VRASSHLTLSSNRRAARSAQPVRAYRALEFRSAPRPSCGRTYNRSSWEIQRISVRNVKGKRMRRLLALPLVVMVGLLAVTAASAGRQQQVLDCEGLGAVTVTVTSTTNDHSVAWGTGKVSTSLHGIPVSFSGTTTDLTTNTVLGTFTQAKGNGHGMHNAQAVTCTEAPLVGTAAELGLTGVNPTDMIEFDFSAQVVLKP